jgi:hypothetical protein
MMRAGGLLACDLATSTRGIDRSQQSHPKRSPVEGANAILVAAGCPSSEPNKARMLAFADTKGNRTRVGDTCGLLACLFSYAVHFPSTALEA